ncbi:MAG: T9SS type A sorting domain-containing protein, partial [Draconibacterium sp.]|nr:T9SS type A sorting domain-containing protein [Draconibacterium sp.]
FENLYGTSGSPDYLPVDIHKDLNVFEYIINPYQFSNGNYFVRVRHRDQNMEWSEWSETKSFVVSGSTEGVPEVSTQKTYYDSNEPIEVLFKNGPNNPKDWIGIYKKEVIPGGGNNSTDWKYTNASSGTITLQVTDGGEYFIALFADDGYTEISDRIWVYITSVPVTTVSKPGFEAGEQIVVNFSNAPSFSNDWIGIYKLNDIPGNVGSTDWEYVSGQTGTVTFNSLSNGYYFANYFLLNEYDEPGEKVYFTVGDDLATISTNKETYSPEENIVVSYQNGPGLQNDWIGIFKTGEETPLDTILVNGNMSGEFIYSEILDSASYYLTLFMNGSEHEISNRVYFSVKSNAVFAKDYLSNESISIYPSPTDGVLNIELSNYNEKIKTIKVTSISGKLVFSRKLVDNKLAKKQTINLSGNKKGIYIISIVTNSSIFIDKILLN